MRKNVRGLSTVVTTLIIILLVLVAVGIIWGVVNNLLNKSSSTIEASTACFDLDVKATKVILDPAGAGDDDYIITLKRSSGGDNNLVYAKLILSSAAGTGELLDFDIGMLPLESKTSLPYPDYSVFNATKIEVTAYYLDDSGSEQLCPITTELEFRLNN